MPQITDLHQHLSEAASLGRVVSGIHQSKNVAVRRGRLGPTRATGVVLEGLGFRRHTFWNTIFVMLFFWFYLKSRQSSFQ